MSLIPRLVRVDEDGRGLVRTGHPLLDAYLELVTAMARSTRSHLRRAAWPRERTRNDFSSHELNGSTARNGN